MRSTRLAAFAAICGLAILPTSALAASFPASAQYGGADHRVDTDAKVKALMLAQHSRDQLSATFDALSPQDQQFVIDRGVKVAKVVSYTVDVPATSTIPSAQALAAASCPSWSRAYRFYSNGYAWTGIKEFSYFSQWQYSGMCYVHSAAHQENSDYQEIGWSYDGSHYGAGYGAVGTAMVGRETFGDFTWAKFALHGQIDQQVKVSGCWGQWGCGGWWVWGSHTGS